MRSWWNFGRHATAWWYRVFMGRPRTWSDDQLRTAVAGAESWSQVVSALGIAKGASAFQTVQRHAARLGLDVTHLHRPRRPPQPFAEGTHSYDELEKVVAECTSWAEVLRRLDVPYSGGTMKGVQQAAAKRGVDISHFTGQTWNMRAIPAPSLPFMSEPDGDQISRAAIGVAIQWFLSRGHPVSLPVEPTVYDLVADSDEDLKKVQVKTSRSRTPQGRFSVGIQCRDFAAANTPSTRLTGGWRPYRVGEIDYFFIHTAAGDNYLIPVEATAGSTTLVLDAKYARFRV